MTLMKLIMKKIKKIKVKKMIKKKKTINIYIFNINKDFYFIL